MKPKKERQPTLKQQRLIANLATSATLKEAGEKAGYSYTAKNLYRLNTKKHLIKALSQMGYDIESMKARFDVGSLKALESNDIANYHRGYEQISKLCHYFNDNQANNIQVNVFTDAIAQLLAKRNIVNDSDNSNKSI